MAFRQLNCKTCTNETEQHVRHGVPACRHFGSRQQAGIPAPIFVWRFPKIIARNIVGSWDLVVGVLLFIDLRL